MRIEVANRIAESCWSSIGVPSLELLNATYARKLTDRNFRLIIWLDEGFLQTYIKQSLVRIISILCVLCLIFFSRNDQLSVDSKIFLMCNQCFMVSLIGLVLDIISIWLLHLFFSR